MLWLNQKYGKDITSKLRGVSDMKYLVENKH